MRICSLISDFIQFLTLVLICSLLLLSTISDRVQAQTIIRLTSNTNNDFGPAWDPRGQTIAYVRQKGAGSSVYDAYKVLSSGQGGEQPLLTGLNTDFGVAVAVSWIGSTGFLAVEEAISGFEVLRFDTSLAPFDRRSTNGADTANGLLLSIDGGGGGGLTKVSRDGLTALIRFSTSGSVGSQTIRSGPVANMAGQTSSQFGTILFSASSTFQANFLQGGAISPTGTVAVLSVPFITSSGPHDLILQSILNPRDPSINLTNSASTGITNINPDISPDGTKIVFSRSSSGNSGPFDLYTIGIDGTGLTQLTNTPNFSETSPSWAPDGTSLAFVGTHILGSESDAPALEPGERANANIYLLSLLPESTVTPKTKLVEPPAVEVLDRTVRFTLTPFKKAAKKAVKAARSALSAQLASLTTPRKQGKVTFKYELVVKPTAGTAGSTRRKFSTRNIVSFKNVPPGNYTSRYRVQIQQKQGSAVKIIGRTKFSPSATFTVEAS